MLPVAGITSAVFEVITLHQLALDIRVHVAVQLVELLLLPQQLLLGLGVVLILELLLKLLLWLIRGRTAVWLRVVIVVVVLLLLLLLLLRSLAVLFLLGPLQDELDIARVLAPLHQNLERVLVGCQQPLVVAPPFDEGEAARFAGGMG